jgi:hypothetical protein
MLIVCPQMAHLPIPGRYMNRVHRSEAARIGIVPSSGGRSGVSSIPMLKIQ